MQFNLKKVQRFPSNYRVSGYIVSNTPNFCTDALHSVI